MRPANWSGQVLAELDPRDGDLIDLMLRGAEPTLSLLVAPFLLGLAFYAVALFGLRRQMRAA